MSFLRNRWVQLAALTLFLASIGINAMRLKYCVLDYDIWWHLKVGDWIIAHMAVPHTGILSRVAENRPWVAYSWGYEVLLSRTYASFGLLGIGIFGILLTIGVAFSAYWMLRRLSGRFWLSCILAGVACSVFLFDLMPRPVFVSQILFCVALTIILEAQRSNQIRTLYWLPLLFLFWANVHIQFVYGLFLVGLFVGVVCFEELLGFIGFRPERLLRPSLPARPLIVVFGLCILATLVGPNFYHPYLTVLNYSKAKFTYNVILELQPLAFRGLNNYIELFLAAAGFYALGWQRKLDLFKLILLVVASVVAFRTMRDGWFLSFSAAACLCDIPETARREDRPESWFELGLAAAIGTVILLLAAPAVNFNTRTLDRAVSLNYPVDAVNFLRRQPFRGPLYNNLNWGGFLMWYLPQLPVAVDGRNDVYGDDLVKQFFESQSGYASYKMDPYLDEAGVVVIDSQLPLAKLLTIDPRFKVVYHDNTATVFLRQ